MLQVEQQEQQDDEEEMKQLQTPQTVEELQAKLAETQDLLQQYQQAEGSAPDTDVLKTIHTPSRSAVGQRGWGSMGLVVFLSVLIGVGVGAAAVNFLVTRGGGPRYSRVGERHQNGVHHGSVQMNGQQSVDEMLREDDLEASLERHRLLNGGARGA